jgi:hypothetical protein
VSALKFLALAGVLGFAYNNSNLFSKPAVEWTNSDMIVLVSAGMLILLVFARTMLQHR